MYFSLQNYSPSNPRPYDDTGWTFQFMRNLVDQPVTDKAILDAADDGDRPRPCRAPGGIEGSGPVVVVEHTTDNNLITFRFKHAT